YDGKEIICAGLEDHFCGKLLGLPLGVDVCYTNHAEADQDDMDNLLTLLAAAGALCPGPVRAEAGAGVRRLAGSHRPCRRRFPPCGQRGPAARICLPADCLNRLEAAAD